MPVKTDLRELHKGTGAVRQAQTQWRQPVFFNAGHLAEGTIKSVRREHRIVAETGRPARGPDQRAVGARLDFLEMAVGPGNTERGHELRTSLVRRGCSAFPQKTFDLRHCGVEILVRSGPTRGENAGRAVKRVDNQARIVGESGELCRLRGRDRLDPRIGAEAAPGLLRLDKAEVPG